jgi:hypothetical protein
LTVAFASTGAGSGSGFSDRCDTGERSIQLQDILVFLQMQETTIKDFVADAACGYWLTLKG